MTRTAQRLALLERRAAPPARQLITVAYRVVGAPQLRPPARVVSLPDGAPTADALAAVARLEAEGYRVPGGIEGGGHRGAP